MKVAAYTRVSTKRQAEEGLSLDDQLASIEKIVSSRGGMVIARFSDSGSGMTDKRPDFQRMMAEALGADRPFDAVAVYSTSRLARNLLISESSIRQLEAAGIQFISATEQTLETLPRAIMAAVHEEYSRQNSRRVGAMMLENAKLGFWNGGPPPYGFRTEVAEQRGKKEKKRLVIDEAESALINQMFQLCLSGLNAGPMGIKQITSWLNLNGHRTRRGGHWQLSTVHAQLNSSYADGFYTRTRGTSSSTRSPEDGETVRIPCPRLVTKPIYDSVQLKLKRDNPFNKAPRIASCDNLLTGVAVCAKCSNGLTVTTGKSGRYRYYSCRGALRGGEAVCAAPTRVPLQDFNNTVLTAILDRVVEEGRLEELLRGIINKREQRAAGAYTDTMRLEAQLLEDQSAIARLYELVEKGLVDISDPVFANRFASLQTKIKINTERVARARSHASPNTAITPYMIAKFANLLRSKLTSESIKVQRLYIGLLVDQIRTDNDTIIIRGRSANLLKSIQADLKEDEVPGRIQEWCTQRDSNS